MKIMENNNVVKEFDLDYYLELRNKLENCSEEFKANYQIMLDAYVDMYSDEITEHFNN